MRNPRTLRFTFQDDRDVEFRYDPRDGVAVDKQLSPAERKVAEQIWKCQTRRIYKLIWLSWLGAAIILFGTLAALIGSNSNIPIRWVVGLTCWLWFAVCTIAWKRRSHHAAVRAIVDIRRCGYCGYPLKGLPVEADGCTVCPECGMGWRLHSETSLIDSA